ncbi:MAG: response regulator transcription factor [Solirubrobacterales bacterium]|nr:response regulator transcription factor [Solirubrobacterales bacterium]
MESVTRQTVMVVDDEPTIVEVVSGYLKRAGFEVTSAADGPEAIAAALKDPPDLIVLDLMLPEINGLEVMRILTEVEKLDVAVILLTSKSEESDRLVGLRRGADDYVVKPFSPAELVARVQAVLRRGRGPVDDGSTPIEIGELLIDPASRIVTRSGEEVQLTQLEFDLLAFLAARPGQAFSRDQLMEKVWESENFEDTGTVTVHVRRLRAKLGEEDGPDLIETVWGIGYRFRP